MARHFLWVRLAYTGSHSSLPKHCTTILNSHPLEQPAALFLERYPPTSSNNNLKHSYQLFFVHTTLTKGSKQFLQNFASFAGSWLLSIYCSVEVVLK
ncbi:hypothetical protein GALMADRAFT_229278 [Galerina marginata CBS 339.88]|uniref:Uncharacterized protein n=1 Tax=Galerina marginata (strain CBS 339.88) TaxID=685588 RepID=A0A067SNW2_GALM3|nr:hypothetical protein GALMADRAFT_229278 [Galerina marginata CBS 339.88]